MNIRKKILWIFAFLYLLPSLVISQNIITTAESLTTCPTEVIVPISVQNFESVGAISLRLDYNTSVLTFEDKQNVHDSLVGGYMIVNASDGTVIISWISTNGATVNDNDTLMELKFYSTGGNSNLVWDTITPGGCEYSDENGNLINANYVNASINMHYAPMIITQAEDREIIEGENTSFSIQATGDNLSYQWQLSTDNGIIWNDLTNSSDYSGVASNTLQILAATLSMNAYQYRCVVSGICSPPAISDEVLLTVDPVPNTITTIITTTNMCAGNISVPINVENCNGVGAISLKLAYDNTLFTYTSFQNLNTELSSGNVIVNANDGMIYLSWASTTAANIGDDDLLELQFVASEGQGSFVWQTEVSGNCEYSDVNGQVFNSEYNDGSITVDAIPEITTQSEDISAYEGDEVDFSIEANGSSLAYQWQISTDNGNTWNNLLNTGIYSGANTSNLHISSVELSMNTYQYQCMLSGTCPPTLYSNAALLTVSPQPQLITTSLLNSVECEGNITIPIQVLDCDNVGAISLMFEYDTSLMTYVNYQSLHSELSSGSLIINSEKGYIYISWASVTPANVGDATLLELNFTGIPGSGDLTWQTANGNCEYSDTDGNIINSTYVNGSITIQETPSIITQATDKTIIEGENANFSISATGSGISYQWEISENNGVSWNALSNNATYSGVTNNTLYIFSASISLDGNLYRCLVSGACSPAAISDEVLLTVNPIPQIITTTIGSTTTMDSLIVLPITVTQCNNVGAISLSLDYDPSVLEYVGFSNKNSELSGFFIVNENNGHLVISWASVTVANIGDDILVELNFVTHVGTTSLTWDTNTPGNCEYSDPSGEIILSEYVNGSVTVNGIILDLKILLEGAYQSTSMSNVLNPNYLPLLQPYSNLPWNYLGNEFVSSLPNSEIVDWILVELREANGGVSNATESTMIARQAGFLLQNGSIVRMNGIDPIDFRILLTQNLYVVIYHRNHLSIISSSSVSHSGYHYSYNFTTSSTQAYGGTDALTQVAPNVWAMIVGDANADGVIDNNDNNFWKTEAGLNGYKSGDFNLNGEVDNKDKNDLWLNNINEESQVSE